MGVILMKELFETLKEIREADNSNRILGENSEAHLLQSRRYSRLAGLLEKDADELEKPPPPEAQDTF
jgi:hypothetical protein